MRYILYHTGTGDLVANKKGNSTVYWYKELNQRGSAWVEVNTTWVKKHIKQIVNAKVVQGIIAPYYEFDIPDAGFRILACNKGEPKNQVSGENLYPQGTLANGVRFVDVGEVIELYTATGWFKTLYHTDALHKSIKQQVLAWGHPK